MILYSPGITFLILNIEPILNRYGNFSIYTTSGVGTWGPQMRIGNSPEIVAITLK
jgi:predicted MPP superfamily phosphohydrolase